MIVALLEPSRILLDDPVRPNIPPQSRIGFWGTVYMHIDDDDRTVGAVLCAVQMEFIPTSEAQLFLPEWKDSKKIAVLYSIWSYRKGAGSKLVREYLKTQQWESNKRIVTMSPKTTMARDFHLRNGAKTLQENEETVNYEYERGNE
jgi:hypothetical protein